MTKYKVVNMQPNNELINEILDVIADELCYESAIKKLKSMNKSHRETLFNMLKPALMSDFETVLNENSETWDELTELGNGKYALESGIKFELKEVKE